MLSKDEKLRRVQKLMSEGFDISEFSLIPFLADPVDTLPVTPPEEEGLEWDSDTGLYKKDVMGQRAFYAPSEEGRWINISAPEHMREPDKWKDSIEEAGYFDRTHSIRLLQGEHPAPLKTPASAGKFTLKGGQTER